MMKSCIDKVGRMNMLLLALMALYVWLLAGEHIVFGAAAGNWVYPYLGHLGRPALLIFVVTTAIVLLLAYLTAQRIQSGESGIVLLWYAVAPLLQLWIRSPYPYSLAELVRSRGATSFYTVTYTYGPLELLRSFESISGTFPVHARANMPGKILLFHLLRIFTPSPQMMGYLIVLISNLGAILTYLIVKRLFGDRRVALYSLILYLFIPARIFFLPLLNTVTPIFVLLSLFLFVQYLATHNNLWLLLVGSSLYFAFCFDPLTLVVGLIFVSLLVQRHVQNEISSWDVVKVGGYSLLAFLAVHAVVWVLFKYDALRGFLTVVRRVASFNTATQRPYGIWVVNNLKEFLLNCGISQAVLLIASLFTVVATLIRMYRERVNGRTVLQFMLEPGPWLTIWFMFTLLFLDLVGVNRGETTRLWIFLTPFVQVIASYYCVTRLSKHAFYVVAASTILQAVTTAGIIGFALP
jgi:hypothetical protein